MTESDVEMSSFSGSGRTSSTDSETRPLEFNLTPVVRIAIDGEFFSQSFEDSESESGSITVFCKKCGPEKGHQIRGKFNCASNFREHLKRVHGPDVLEAFDEYVKRRKLADPGVEVPGEKRTTQDGFNLRLVRFASSSGVSFSSLEDACFKELMAYAIRCSANIKVPSRRSLMAKFAEYSQAVSLDSRRQVKEADHVCLTTDLWTSRRKSFIGVTAHYIDKNLKRQSIAIACRRVKGRHTYDKILEHLEDIRVEYELDEEKVTAWVTDNGSNFVKAFKTLGVDRTNIEAASLEDYEDTDDENTDDEDHQSGDDEPVVVEFPDTPEGQGPKLGKHRRCGCHTLSLSATTDLKKCLNQEGNKYLKSVHDRALRRCNFLWRAARRPLAREKLMDILGFALERPIEVRWNSLHDAFCCILKIEGKNDELAEALHMEDPLTEEDFRYIKEFVKCMSPFADAIDLLQREYCVYYGDLITIILSLEKKLRNIVASSMEFCRPIAQSCIISVKQRFLYLFHVSDAVGEEAVAAALCSPRVKKTWLSLVPEHSHDLYISYLRSEVIKEVQRQEKAATASSAQQSSQSQNSQSSSSSSSQELSKMLSFFEFNTVPSATDAYTVAEAEMAKFFSDPERDISMLNRYKYMKPVFVRLNTSLPSSGPVERLFSIATFIDSPRSNRLTDENFEKRVLLKANLHEHVPRRKGKKVDNSLQQ